uniref:Uncharacterized protein n=1 Tax=Ditylenchus dipsaci TaxID=166011 RepID=A0A915CM18_9BILA
MGGTLERNRRATIAMDPPPSPTTAAVSAVAMAWMQKAHKRRNQPKLVTPKLFPSGLGRIWTLLSEILSYFFRPAQPNLLALGDC